MAIFHVATNTPPKSEIIREWIHQQPWGPPDDGPIELVGSFHLDDPDGEVGMQVFVVRAADTLFQVPLTYRDAPLADGGDAFIAEMEHSVLGTRFVHDGLGDAQFVSVLAGVTGAGYGQALGFAEHDGRLYAWADELLVRGAGKLRDRVPIDGFAIASHTQHDVVLQNDNLELTVVRRLDDRPPPTIGLTVTWASQPRAITLVAARQISR